MALRSDIKVGFACNNRCVFCAQGQKRSEIGRVPPEELVQRMRSTYERGKGLVLTGGEPTIRADLVKLVEAARRIGYSPIQIQTNGRMLAYPGLVEKLLAAGVTEFSPALHGPTADVHDALTRAPGSFDQTVAGIRNTVASKRPVITNTVVAKGNLHCLAETVKLLADLGVEQGQLAMVHPVGTAQEMYDEVVPRLDEAAPAVRDAVMQGRARGMRVVVEALPPCFLRGLEDAVVEAEIPETTVVDLDGAPFAFSTWRRDEGKVKGPPCESCTRAERCEGPWREYPERQGWDGYVPYSDDSLG